MFNWQAFFAHLILFFISSCSILKINKLLRGKRGALSRNLCLDDVLCLLVVSCLIYWINLSQVQLLQYFSLTIIGLYGLLVWVDSLLFVQYRIEVNRQTLAWFLTGRKGVAKGIPHLFLVLNEFHWGAIIPILWISTSILFLIPTNKAYPEVLFTQLVIFSFFNLTIMLISSINNKVNIINFSIILVVFIIFPYYLNTYKLIFKNWDNIQFILSIFGFTTCLTLPLLFVIKKYSSIIIPFFSTPSLIKNIFFNDNITYKHKQLKESRIINIKPQTKSDFYGSCKESNIILITMESLGPYIPPYNLNAANSKLVKRFSKQGWLSKQHYCLCPNTTVATNQIYTGAYSNNPYNKEHSHFFGENPEHIATLKKHGYKTMFLDSADIKLYDYWKLLKRIGFNKVWGTDDIPNKGLKADYRLFNMIDQISKEISDSPFFLHIINDQTHMPYEVIDKEKFNRHKNNTKGKYLNALEEVDHILDTFLEKLSEKVDLSNTILVLTGDHGESFGEYGYSFHSNSVIPPQVHVPFILTHPNLPSKEIKHSCHFDIFPTFFDLLGIEYNYSCLGSSIAEKNREQAYFFHSATLKGNTPANFSLLLNNDLYWVDRLFSKSYQLKHSNNQWVEQNKTINFPNSLLSEILHTHKLIK